VTECSEAEAGQTIKVQVLEEAVLYHGGYDLAGNFDAEGKPIRLSMVQVLFHAISR
jgi:hypothetical protein